MQIELTSEAVSTIINALNDYKSWFDKGDGNYEQVESALSELES